ncbi:mechanosensitive ion channel family protein [Macrococcoides bohemicum]|uniref:Mechanosensitive ion channel protein MscS n=2 Tax=Macrococcoides bohemicum TaxID=1903056 RepID=A0A328A364_9STAP|nr:mechanosensitive ion channel family protein [Macrococcus bohemicus]MBC9873881.1 mechanosensitive ion channel family protein [Macrococcus bohemicus]QRN50926.1 mechanosensitive ion channel family protein [Macrococcus bohemicus]QYA46021.1 mechanosensitive ion channel family protein [Macrococcus bohemicus]RAK48767.1 mechanosensitive ion channel protein MscS [Macrococcus bohemicus]TDL38475.1 mechanosensitive ion channel family protein [Macrococcus bohemicus]
MWLNIATDILWSIMLIIIAVIIVRIVNKFIEQFFRVRRKTNFSQSTKRDTTLIKLLQNIASYVIWFIVLTTILSNFGVKVESIIAGAGIAGIAIGFGAQTLVKDVITGFFIIFENQFDVGDYVRINTTGTTVAEGTVQSIGLRSTRIKSFTGELTILPNGTMNEIVNFSVNNSIAIFDISVSSEENISHIESILQPYLLTLPEKYADLVKAPEMLGVEMVSAGETKIRMSAETLPNNHVKVSRILRGDIKEFLDQNGIHVPMPRVVMYNQPNKGDHNAK